MIRMKHAILLTAQVVAMSACNGHPTTCSEPGVEVVPAERTLAVGASFTPTATLVACSGDRSPYAAAWRTVDKEVVEVDPVTGLVTGLAPGVAVITAHDPTVSANWAWGEVRVTVQAP